MQGVGFRPLMYQRATRWQLTGCVRNQGGGAWIEIEGTAEALDAFLAQLVEQPPLRARIDHVDVRLIPEQGSTRFVIEPSADVRGDQPIVSPDLAMCDACRGELFCPRDRRHDYALLSCTQCGPRFTITRAVPYDRANTSLTEFPLCAECQREYEDPTNRWHHAQGISCPKCGPQLHLYASMADAITTAASALAAGQIVALKSLGGYQLACDASNAEAVSRLRSLKQRDAKPLAIMVSDLETARRLTHISAAEERLLSSPAAPIVLLRQRAEHPLASSIAPRNRDLGIMLAYTPLHAALLHAARLEALVMTSGNAGDEPIVCDDQQAIERLGGMSDWIVMHNRPIVMRCDDSVVRVVDESVLPLRRARGFVPAPIDLPLTCRQPILALGGQLKSTFALGAERQAFVSHHLGDLDHLESFAAFSETIDHYQRLLRIDPCLFVHDMHPDYASTTYARQRVPAESRLAVQHHHAHLASCLAEHGLNEPVIGVIFDGSGYGPDGSIWGGEFLIGDYTSYRRAAHLNNVPLLGGEQAIRQPWRCALAHLRHAAIDWIPDWPEVSHSSLSAARKLLAGRFQAPLTSSVGRLFDAIAALVQLRTAVQFEGQAALELEWLADDTPEGVEPYPFELCASQSPMQIDTRPLIAAVVHDLRAGVSPRQIAQRFHGTVIAMVVDVCVVLREQTDMNTVALSGGVFMNVLVLSGVTARLRERGFRVLRHECVPPNDGGLSLGQLAIAAAWQNRDN